MSGLLRRHRWTATGAGLVAVYVLLLVVDAAAVGNIHTGDTDNLVAGARVALRCLDDGTWVGCGGVPGNSLVRPYALLQYLPAAGLVGLGHSDTRTVELLANLSLVAFVAILGLSAWSLRRNVRLAGLAIAAVLASSATYQATAGFSEMLSAATVLGVVVAARERRATWLALACFLAVASKETLPPFVLLLAVLAARSEGDRWLPPRRLLVGLVAGVVGGIVASLAFNVFRFSTPRNLGYLDPSYRTPGIVRKGVFAAGVWLSPSAGVLWFWPLASMVLLGTLAVGARRFAADRQAVRAWGPPFGVVATALGFSAGLALWCTPFGWIAYGPRLAVPILPALVVLALHVAGEDLLRGAAGLPGALRVVAVAVALLGAWGQLAAPWRHQDGVQALIAGDDTCPPMLDYPIGNDPGYYYECATHVMWRLRPAVLPRTWARPGGVPLVAQVVGAAVVLLAASAITRPPRVRVP